ncbi:heme exporter protein CcmD [Roseovarius dicentrarchi]|uniref:heme exporter protein CcmD n=1 Tax=Roseovarius dicentrarchi TaxID=2250573 RepID=UPI000DEB7154
MPELGKYAVAVLSSYGISVALLTVLCALSVMRARRMRRDLAQIEGRVRRNG